MAPLRDSSKLLAKLRLLMKDPKFLNGKHLQAYIVPSSDAHGSEYLCDKDKRRQFISGFTGSAGTAVITEQNALLWTDGRYFLQASQELDASSWQLMKDGLPETPSISEWLAQNLPVSSLIGIDSTLYEEDLYTSLSNKLAANKLELTHIKTNLVDRVWEEYDKPKLDLKPLRRLEQNDFGKRTSEKLMMIREEMPKRNTEALVVTSLDEIAWLLNLRGHDIPYGTVFFSYLIITLDSCKLFTDLRRIDETHGGNISIRSYLLGEEAKFEFFDYALFYDYLSEFVHREFVKKYSMEPAKKKIYLSSSSNHAIHSLVPSDYIYKDTSFLAKLKVIKNTNEIEAAKRIHIRDSRLLVEFFHKIQTNFELDAESSSQFDEFTLGRYLDDLRKNEVGSFSPSFETICGFGSNGAIIHYKAKPESCKKIEANNILLVDSGGHYADMGTTDVTRTVFLGDVSKISSYQKECFTRVLKGHIQLASCIFPSGTSSELIDSFARKALWNVGLNYRHGTGHGIGALLNVHELPIIAHRRGTDIVIRKDMIITIEPGYYEENAFGIRIENCNLTIKATTKYNSSSKDEFLTFEPLTYVPIQRELIDVALLTQDELEWLNTYHSKCLSVVGAELKNQSKTNVYNWLVEQTKPLVKAV